TAADSYVWYFEGTEIPGATGQSYTPTATGHYLVLGSYAGGCELLSDTVYVALTGIGSNQAEAVRVHPIPASDKLMIEGLPSNSTMLRLMDLTGRIALSASIANG